MCYAKPGPRCSGHARKTFNSKEQKLNKAAADVKDLKKAHDANPEDMSVKKEYVAGIRKYRQAKKEFSAAQRDFDGTPAGRTELENRLAGKCSIKERKELKTRLREGKMMYSWRKHQLDMKRLEKSTGLSLKQRRGKFLTSPGEAPALAA